MRYIITLILLTQDLGSYDDIGVKQISVIDWLLKS